MEGWHTVTVKDIPAEIRWEIATRSANSLSVAQYMLLRQAFGEKVDQVVTSVYGQGGKEVKAIADALGLHA